MDKYSWVVLLDDGSWKGFQDYDDATWYAECMLGNNCTTEYLVVEI